MPRLAELTGLLRRSPLAGQLLRGSVGSLVLRAAAIGAALLASILLARGLGPSGLGTYSLALALISLIGLPVQMGLPTLVLRETARLEALSDWPRMRGLWRWANTRILWSSIVVIAVVGALVISGLEAKDRGAEITLAVGLPLVALIALGRARGAALRGLHRPLLGQLPEDVLRPGILAFAAIGALLAGSWPLSPPIAMALHVGSALFAFLIGAVLLRRCCPPGLATAIVPQADSSDWRRAVWPLAIISGLQVLSQTLDIVILSIWHPAEQVGFYKIAVSAAGLAVVGLKAVNLVFAPQVARMHGQGETERLSRLVALGNGACVAITIPTVAALAVWGKELLALFYGDQYRESYIPMLILLLGHAANSAFGLTAVIVAMTGNESTAMRMLVISALANVGLNALLTPPYGVVGAAIASGLSSVLWGALFWQLIYRRLGIDSSVMAVGRLLFRSAPRKRLRNEGHR